MVAYTAITMVRESTTALASTYFPTPDSALRKPDLAMELRLKCGDLLLTLFSLERRRLGAQAEVGGDR